MNNLIIAMNAVVPLLFYVVFGYIARNRGLVDVPFLKRLNGFVFHAFFPFIMFQNMYTMDFSESHGGRLLTFAMVSLFALIALLLLIVPRVVHEDSRKGVIIQALFRSNTLLFALPLMESVYGQQGAAITTWILAFMIPCYNIASVLILEHFRGGRSSAGKLIRDVLHNPLIIGAIAGLAFALSPLTMPECLAVPISKVAGLATPMALFCLGGNLEFSSMFRHLRYIIPVLLLKLILIPAVIVLLMVRLGFNQIETFAVFCTFATPIAAASYAMSQEMGGDADLAGELLLCSTVVSGITLFFWIYLMKSLGVF